jgi:Histidine-specific methyltransferase, SAM-dependent
LRNVIAGLRTRLKSLPCKYFYDQRGSELFDRICQLEEYYLIRSELSLMDRFAPEIGAIGDWLVRAEWIGRFLDRAQTLGRYAVGPTPCLKNSNLF